MRVLSVMLIVVVSAAGALAQYGGGYSRKRLMLSADIGLSKAVGNEGAEWDLGWSAGGNAFYLLNPNLLLGLRYAYNSWSPNQDELLESVDDAAGFSVDGSATLMEFVPTVRLSTAWEFNLFNFFLQGGAGYWMQDVEVTIDPPALDAETVTDDEDKFGLSLGGGVILGDYESFTFEVTPLFHLLFPMNDFHYFTVSAGAAIKL
jgi:hypothetical protein